MNLMILAPGSRVACYDDVYLFAGTADGAAVLVEDLRVDLSCGYTGYPAVTGLLTATATATTYRAIVVDARDISRA